MILSLWLPSPLQAAPPAWFQNDPAQPWHITADEISQDRSTGVTTASGNVIITQKSTRMSAQRVRFNQNTMQLTAEGSVVLTAGGDILTGDRIDLDLKTETGTLTNATLFSQETHFYIAGERIEKLDKNRYTLTKGSVTTCDGDQPTWRITCRSLDVTVEGYGIARGAALRVMDVPILYSPIMAFPAKTTRQTGLLIPQFGTSQRKGFEFNQPLFWAINEQSDATAYWNHMEKRGEKLGGEYRYMAAADTFGTIMADALKDQQVDDGTQDATSKWGYPDDGYDRTNKERYWFRMKHNIDLGTGMSAKLDADVVSDQDYLKEFQTGYNGFDDGNVYFTSTFGRGLDDMNDPDRLNMANFNKTWDRFVFNADARWYDNALIRSQGLTNSTLQQMPDLTLSGSRQPVMKTPLMASGTGQYVYFYRDQGQTGHRMDLYPRLYWPMSIKRIVNIEPSVGVRETIWYLDRAATGGPADDKTYTRPMADFSMDASTELYRVFDMPGSASDRWRHLMRPQVIYTYIPNRDQSALPYFDITDRIAEQNTVTYSLTNTVTTRTTAVTAAARTEAVPAEPAAVTYHEFGRLKLQQSFDINAANQPQSKPFSPVYAELIITPKDWYSVRADANWSVNDGNFVDHNVMLGIWDHSGDRFTVEHRYTREQSESLFAGAEVSLWEGLKAYGTIERDVKNGENIKNQIGILFSRQCWSVDTQFTEEPNNRAISFLITLHGIGSVGSGFSPDSITGGN
ncbi:MAG: LPS assembly protein LptD [Pseudomonadota bacterium]